MQQEGCTYLYEYASQVRALVAALQQCAASAGGSSQGLWPLQLLQLCCASWVSAGAPPARLQHVLNAMGFTVALLVLQEACATLMEQQATNPGQDVAQELQPAHAAAQ